MAESEHEEPLSALTRLKNDRLVKVYIGSQDSEPYLIQQQLLERHTDYFAAALQSNAFREGKEGAITLCGDNEEACQVLLNWLLVGKLHSCMMQDMIFAVDCWVLGDKYNITAFQDEVMLALLHHIEDERRYGIFPTSDNFRDAICASAPGSKLRLLMAQEVVLAQKHYCEDPVCFDSIDGTGFFSEFMATLTDYESRYPAWESSRFELNRGETWEQYRDFLVGDGPVDHFRLPFALRLLTARQRECD